MFKKKESPDTVATLVRSFTEKFTEIEERNRKLAEEQEHRLREAELKLEAATEEADKAANAVKKINEMFEV